MRWRIILTGLLSIPLTRGASRNKEIFFSSGTRLTGHCKWSSQISEKTADVARSMQLKPLLEPFPKFDGNHFRAIVDQEMGFL